MDCQCQLKSHPTTMAAGNLSILFSLALSNIVLTVGADYTVFPSAVAVKQGGGFVLQVVPADTPLKSCTLRVGTATIPLTPGGENAYGMTYWGRSLDKGDCGVKVAHANATFGEKWVFVMVTVSAVTRTAFSHVEYVGNDEPPPPVEIDAEIGGDTSLKCDALAQDAVYCKLRDPRGTTISSGTNCTIVINMVKITDEGTWTCITGTRTAITEQQAPIIVTVKPVKTLNISTEDTEMGVSVRCQLPKTAKLQNCRFQRPDGMSLIMADGLSSDRFAYIGQGLANNDCSVLIMKPMKEEDYGIWKCIIGLEDGTESGGFIALNAPGKSSEPINHTIGQPSKLFVIDGSSLTMDCTIDAALDYCWFQHPNGTRHYGLQDSGDSTSWRYHGEGLSLGHCGLTVNQTAASDSGKWICGMGIRGEPITEKDLEREFEVVVTASLLIEKDHDSTAAHGENIALSCYSLQGEALHYCRFTSPNGSGFNLFPQQIETSYSRYTYQGAGLEYGECGILIKNVREEDYGTWQCGARLVGNSTQELTRDLILSQPGITSSSAIGLGVALAVVAICIVGYVVYRRGRATLAQQAVIRPVAVSIASDTSDEVLNLQVN